MSRNHARTLLEDQRLCILQTLADSPRYASNENVLQTSLQWLGHSVSRDRVRTIVDWLAEQDLVRVEEVNSTLRIVTLTAAGNDVSTGMSRVSGVRTPPPV